MKIKTQIALTLFLALFAVTGICLAIALYHIRSNSDHDIAASRKMELERTQAHLKDVVDISFSLLENQTGANQRYDLGRDALRSRPASRRHQRRFHPVPSTDLATRTGTAKNT